MRCDRDKSLPGDVSNIYFQIIMNMGFLLSASMFHQFCTENHKWLTWSHINKLCYIAPFKKQYSIIPLRYCIRH